MQLFEQLDLPEDLHELGLPDLEALAQDLRQVILNTCLANGGHLAASLGCVELALALHAVFRSPQEPIVWDIGHQAYAHKLLTGRWRQFGTLRKTGGISGFLVRSESEHDVFGGGHSSTALSAALAMAWARGHGQDTSPPWTVAVVGDGSLTAGLSFEALNNVPSQDLGPFLVVLNDNQMSISPNIGGIPAVLSSGKTQQYFEYFGFEYLGPVDGHDLRGLIATLNEIRARHRDRPVILHTFTQKGKGYAPAEEIPAHYHGVSPVRDKVAVAAGQPGGKTYSEYFGESLCELAASDPRVLAITAAMTEGTGLGGFARLFPDRLFDVGIAEPHAVTFAAGLATQGYRPVVAIYSTFLQRAIDEIIHDVVLQNLPVIFAIDRAGVVGPDGPTHHGVFDLAYMGMIPELVVTAPSCLEDLRFLLGEALKAKGPFAIRYPRDVGAPKLDCDIRDGLRWHQEARAPEVIAIALGTPGAMLADAAKRLDPDAVRISAISTIWAKPIPEALLNYLNRHSAARLLVIEDGTIRGGFGEGLISRLTERKARFRLLGYGDRFIPQGKRAELEQMSGLSGAGITAALEELLG